MDDNDDTVKAAMIVVSAVVVAVLALVIGFATTHVGGHKKAPVVALASDEVPAPVGEALVKIYFEVGSADLLPETGGALKTVYDTAQAQPGKIVLISGFHDPSGDPAMNAELAKRRATASRDALVAMGLPADRIRLRKPEATSENGDNQEARRVEFRVQ